MEDEWDNVSETNRHVRRSWMYPQREKCTHNTDRVWAQQRKNGKFEAVIHRPHQDREKITLDVDNMDDAKAMALMLFKMR